MQRFNTFLAAGLSLATITAAPAPSQADEAGAVLRLLNGLIADGYTSRRGDYRGRYWNDDDDDGYRRGRNDDDDDGYRARRWNDDDDDGGRYDDDDD
ncbi:hypothetical protein [Roseovarius atlanticus]|nr:hypothetical protein [Roseovarius atlanticus]